MSAKYAILVDGGFVLKKLKSQFRRSISAQDVEDECKKIATHPALNNCKLLRIYYYDAPPASETLRNPIDKSILELSKTPVFKESNKLLSKLELISNFAVRLGGISTTGWQLGKNALKSLNRSPRSLTANDFVPNTKQKGVDLRIGLDIARLSLLHIVDAIVVVTGDSDLVPAFKFARREGLRVYLYHMGHPVHRDLKVHVDIVL